MTSALVDHGSPLDDYLNDTSDDMPTVDVGPVFDNNYIFSSSTPAATTHASSDTVPDKQADCPEDGHRAVLTEEGFSERFKYAICSSGLLEKDYVPGFGGPTAEDRQPDTAGAEGLPSGQAENTVFDLAGSLQDVRQHVIERWDITLAFLTGLIGIYRLTSLTFITVIIIVTASTAIWSKQRTPSLVTPHSTPTDRKPPKPLPRPLASLNAFLSTSTSLDQSIEKSLSILQPLPPNSTAHHDLRLSLNRLTLNMTDHLATATSQLLEKTDKQELAVLGEMYDIPVAGSFLYSRKSLGTAESDDDGEEAASRGFPVGSIPSPRRPGVPLLPADGLFAAQPMSISQSLPGRFKPTHRTHHLSLSGASTYIHPSLRSAPEDRFTSLPERTPRFSKRASWDSHRWAEVQGGGLSPSPLIQNRRLSRPPHERRITEADEGDGLADLTSEPSTRQAVPLVSGSTSPIPISRPFTPKRSPLSGYGSDHSPRPSIRSPPIFSPMTPNPKRRSLQNLPYNPPISDTRSETDLTRSTSLPFSDIQTLRSKYATGSRSRRESLPSSSSGEIPTTLLTSPTPAQHRIRRVVSISPLTLPSLKASCLGIHLRRRRLACCLLGLRFDEDEATYWSTVISVLDDLTRAMEEEVNKLEQEYARITLIRSQATRDDVSEPWLDAAGVIEGKVDFAPKTPDEILLRDKIAEMEDSLHNAWKGLQETKKVLSDCVHRDDVERDLKGSWREVRKGLGFLVRDWERGKEVVNRLSHPASTSPTSDTDRSDTASSTGAGAVPGFIRAWTEPIDRDLAEDDMSASTSFESDQALLSLEGQADMDALIEHLPPPGQDVIFEADLSGEIPTRERSTLSREERIRLAKEAREKGVSLKHLLNGVSGDAAAPKSNLAEHGMVVEEMKSMIGMIKARKGIGETASDEHHR